MPLSKTALIALTEDLLARAKKGSTAAMERLRRLEDDSKEVAETRMKLQYVRIARRYAEWLPVAAAAKAHFSKHIKIPGAPTGAEVAAYAEANAEFHDMCVELLVGPKDLAELAPSTTKQEPGKWLLKRLARRQETTATKFEHRRAAMNRQKADEHEFFEAIFQSVLDLEATLPATLRALRRAKRRKK